MVWRPLGWSGRTECAALHRCQSPVRLTASRGGSRAPPHVPLWTALIARLLYRWKWQAMTVDGVGLRCQLCSRSTDRLPVVSEAARPAESRAGVGKERLGNGWSGSLG
jgi:hypothetical protein